MNAGADIVQTRLMNAISIPAKALFTLNGKPSVYVKKEGQYIPQQVNVRARNPDEVAIEGLTAGTLVALSEPVKKQ
jgi:hypothetical protein